jgi:hypothetical protein
LLGYTPWWEKPAMETANPYPSPDESLSRLRRAGWSVSETATAGAWIVSGHNGENMINARGKTQAEAWHRAVEQAEAVHAGQGTGQVGYRKQEGMPQK